MREKTFVEKRFADRVKTWRKVVETRQWRKRQRRAGNRSYLHEVGRVAGWGDPPLGREFPL